MMPTATARITDPSPSRYFDGADGLRIAADVAGPETGRPVILMHGGGQTRGSWKAGLHAIAERGYRVFALDLRGHGASDWDPAGDYRLDAFVRDLRAVMAQLPPRPVLVGASMGGVTQLALLGEPDAPPARALVLIDVTPQVNQDGAARIGAFMRANADGFGSLEEVADAVSAYNPHRPRPADISGLRRNLREVGGRLFWHWDPQFMATPQLRPTAFRARLEAAAQGLRIPTLLVRGTRSELVGDAEVAHFRALVPEARYVDVAGAGHMVAGDRNDAFNAAIVDFLAAIDPD
ncbi:alpha/beta fold hydrolase [Sphingomonas sp. CJ20]